MLQLIALLLEIFLALVLVYALYLLRKKLLSSIFPKKGRKAKKKKDDADIK